MSWFGQIVGGLAEGAAKGGAAEAEYRDKLDAKRELQRERGLERQDLQTQRLDMQRESQQAQRDQQRWMTEMRIDAQGSRRGSGGGSEGGVGWLYRLAQEADTPEKQNMLIASFKATGNADAANTVANMFGRGAPTEDRTVQMPVNDDDGNPMPGPTSYVQRAQFEAKKGVDSVNHVLAMAAGKYKDFTEGEARAYGTDVVRAAGDDDQKQRRAGAVNRALEGKDRTGVSNGTEYDKAGVSASKTTEVGRSVINENNAQAGSANAAAGKYRASTGVEGKEIKTKEFQALQQERISMDKDLDRASDALKALRQAGRQSGETGEQFMANVAAQEKKIASIESDKAQVQTRIRDYTTAEGARGRGEKAGTKADPNPAPAAPQPSAAPTGGKPAPTKTDAPPSAKTGWDSTSGKVYLTGVALGNAETEKEARAMVDKFRAGKANADKGGGSKDAFRAREIAGANVIPPDPIEAKFNIEDRELLNNQRTRYSADVQAFIDQTAATKASKSKKDQDDYLARERRTNEEKIKANRGG